MTNQSFERNGELIHVTPDGEEYVLDELGNRRPPMQAAQTSTPGQWLEYETGQGHCGLCGRLMCRGGCFK